MSRRIGSCYLGRVLAAGVMGLILTQNSCTLIGLTMGVMSDRGKPKGGEVPGWKWEAIEYGANVTVRMRDGSKVKGTFHWISQESQESYSRRYGDLRTTDSVAAILPSLGDTVVVTQATGDPLTGKLLGFDQRFESGKVSHCVRILPADQFTSRVIPIDHMARLTNSAGGEIDAATLTHLAATWRLPISTGVVILSDKGREFIPCDRIDQLSYPARHGAVTGLLIGLAVDAAIVIIAAATYEPEPLFDSLSFGSSCPYVYAFDGERYVRDAELFAGSIFRAAQRGDWTRLDHLALDHGRYRLKITNERDETEYVDEVALLVVEHPSGTQVVPTFGGTLCLLSNPEPPLAATDLAGSDVLDLVSATDDEMWISNPFGRNPDDSSQLRDGLSVQFRRPPGADSVTLALNVGNTPWGAYLQNQFVQLLGKDVQAWYDTLNNSPVAREALHRTMVREGMLLIQLWDGKSWRPAGHVWEVGPAVAKDMAVQLDLRDIPGDSLCVRLESTVGLWMINSVRADYSSGVVTKAVKLLPETAKDSHGRDLRKILLETDADYYEMPTTNDWAELTFVSPLLKPDHERSFILQSAGYYSIHTPGTGEPHTELVQRMMAEPGAFGRYSLRLLNGYLQTAMVEGH